MPPILTMTSLSVNMSLKSEENSDLKPEELVFLLAIAGRIDAQSRYRAKKLHKNRYIYHAFAILDSLSSSYSMFKYFFEVFNSTTDPDLMHEFLTSPEGIAAITGEALFLVTFSLLASLYDGEEKDSAKKFIAAAWPYFRDVIKGLKNAYKGWRSTVQIISIFSGVDLKFLVIPVGLVLGVMAAANRLWLRDMVERRKKQMDNNRELLFEIEQLPSLTLLDRKHYLKRIGYQDEEERIHAYFAVAAGGLIDGLYLYAGVASLSILAPPLFLAMTVFSAIYTLACIVTRIYEEYDFQLRLLITQTKCKFALITKEMETTYARLLTLEEIKNKTSSDLEEIRRLRADVCRLIQKFEDLRQILKEQTTHTYLTAGLLGMKYGLFAYGVVTSFLFMTASVFLVTATAFPPALLAAFIVSGMVLMLGFTAYTLRAHYLHLQKQEKEREKEHPYEQLLEMKNHMQTQDDAALLTAEGFKESVKDGKTLEPSPQFFFQEWFEVFRCSASGLSKGNNFAGFVMTPLQEVDADGHYQNTPVMAAIAIASAVLFSVVLSLRALARGFGRSSLGETTTVPTTDSGLTDSTGNDLKTERSREASDLNKKKSPDSLPRNDSSISHLSFFNTKQKSLSPSQRSLVHSKSDSSLDKLHIQTNDSIILGLE
jgi:hypothetical protein